MGKDYKPRGKTPARKRSRREESSGLSGVMGFGSGLVVGACLGVLGMLWFGPADVGVTRPSTSNAGNQDGAGLDPDSAEAVPAPEFDFYAILPEMEVKVPTWALDEMPDSGADDVEGPFVVQVGSFREYADADRVKATLALQGLDADIQRVVINGQDTWFRVRIGPFDEREALRDVRGRLAQNGMDYLLLKIRDAAPP